MKNQTLSIGQMLNLKKLGIDTSKASMVLVFKDDDGEICEWDSVNENDDGTFSYIEPYDNVPDWDYAAFHRPKPLYVNYLDAQTGDYDHSYRETCGVFTLHDVIELLPKKIDEYELKIKMFAFGNPDSPFYRWSVLYESTDMLTYLDTLAQSSYDELLEAAYEMLCLCAKHRIL